MTPERPKRPPRRPQEAPKTAQEALKDAKDGLQDGPRALQDVLQEGPQGSTWPPGGQDDLQDSHVFPEGFPNRFGEHM
eukprot:1130107-Pyramimonas_sp.AAC.1